MTTPSHPVNPPITPFGQTMEEIIVSHVPSDKPHSLEFAHWPRHKKTFLLYWVQTWESQMHRFPSGNPLISQGKTNTLVSMYGSIKQHLRDELSQIEAAGLYSRKSGSLPERKTWKSPWRTVPRF